ncbi:hypothetical protein AB4Y67_07800 [Arthrobacter sp. YAF17]|uniref:hypothetical protein n=1 Tax=Arthrobacter sp. YAF17 TaxID=3233077 RepID=UPI003F901EA8
MGKFRGWHIVAGIAAMVLTGILGTAMGLNNTAAFMSSCVAFVAVALWTDSRITLRRRQRARALARETAEAAGRDDVRPEQDRQFGAEPPNREGRGT